MMRGAQYEHTASEQRKAKEKHKRNGRQVYCAHIPFKIFDLHSSSIDALIRPCSSRARVGVSRMPLYTHHFASVRRMLSPYFEVVAHGAMIALHPLIGGLKLSVPSEPGTSDNHPESSEFRVGPDITVHAEVRVRKPQRSQSLQSNGHHLQCTTTPRAYPV